MERSGSRMPVAYQNGVRIRLRFSKSSTTRVLALSCPDQVSRTSRTAAVAMLGVTKMSGQSRNPANIADAVITRPSRNGEARLCFRSPCRLVVHVASSRDR